ncbi:MAG: hypothetical protein Q9162_004188 [Coniocarpon cinnabarinum]
MQFGNCSTSSGLCTCPPGFGDQDCSKPLCGSLADGEDRPFNNKQKDPDHPEKSLGCDCADGWEGLNCNVCKTNEACGPLKPEGTTDDDMICYKQGLVQKENHQMCDVTNKQIVEQLSPKKAQVTFSCNADAKTCNFQFWIGGEESFYCGLDTCSWKFDAQEKKNVTNYQCENIHCRCVPGRQLCGEGIGIDLSDFLAEEIKGPGAFREEHSGSGPSTSVFTEPAMDDMISSVFGDKSITLSCNSGECLYKMDVPGFEKPIKKINTPVVAGAIAGSSIFIVAVVLLIWWLSRRSNRRRYTAISLSSEDDRDDMLMADHRPASLHFENVSYAVNGKQILNRVQGAVRPGELMAIMGASGAGKTTFLDILARKNKKGTSTGEFYVNGEIISDSDFRSVIGFVDQDDIMLPTLTVHETILDSAKLRLPADMPIGAKERRVEDVERQLGIHQIRDSIVGSEETRGISGGEKRRVGIACELITSPSILFLDEPTSGLDAYNAYNVIECLVNLVKTYNRTVVFTIHQPRSNIVALFDQLILLAQGRTVYSGPFSSCQGYFDSIGYACPPGFNIADYLVDLTMHAGSQHSPMDDVIAAEAADPATRSSSLLAVKSVTSKSNLKAEYSDIGSEDEDDSSSSDRERRGITTTRPSHEAVRRSNEANRRISVADQQARELFTRKKPQHQRPKSPVTPTNFGEEGQLLLNDLTQDDPLPETHRQRHPRSSSDLDNLVTAYATSDVAVSLADDIRSSVASAKSANGPNGAATSSNGSTTPTNNNMTPSSSSSPNSPVGAPLPKVKGYKKVGIPGQFLILAVRTWRNLYRNPMLMLTHYAIAILLAVFLGFLFFGLTDSISGFQNRLGLFFFVLALFGFSTLTSLTVFSAERLLFVRERAKGYYSPVSYFAAKVLFDIVPLRLIPPVILGGIVYPMTGLLPSWPHFLTFLSFLILFNFAAAAICLFLGILVRNPGVANLIGSLTMLFSLLFAGFLLNRESIPTGLHWLQNLSIFHYGFEGLIVNEVKELRLVDKKYSLDIEVPGAVILSTFGFDTQALVRDVWGLVGVTIGGLAAGLGVMWVWLVERR